MVFNTALGFDSRGTTLSQASLHPEDGGFSLPPPRHLAQGTGWTCLYGIRSELVRHAVFRAANVSSMGYQIWGFMAPEVTTPSTARSGPIFHNGFLAQSLKSYSQARRYVIDGAPEGANIRDYPLWHSAIFRNSDNLTYYCPAQIRKGVMCISDLFGANFCPRQDLLPKIGITWREVYTSFIKQFHQLMPTDWSIPSVWVGSWGKSASLKKLSPMPYMPRRQPTSA